MKTTDKEFMTNSMEKINAILEEIGSGKSARDVAAEMYANGLPDKTTEMGYLMADEILKNIENYHTEVDKSIEDGDKYLQDEIDAIASGKSPVECCEMYHKTITALAAYEMKCDGRSDEEIKNFVEENSNFAISADDAETMIDDLRYDTIDAIKRSDIALSAIPGMLSRMNDANVGFDLCTGVFDYGRESTNTKLLLSMQTYIDANNGVYEDVDADTPLEQVVYSICGTVDTLAVAGKMESDPSWKEIGLSILKAIGRVLAISLLIYLSVKTALVLTVLLTVLFPFLSIASVVIAALICYWLVSENKEWVANVGSKVFEILGYVLNFTAGVTIKGVKLLARIACPIIRGALSWLFETISIVKTWVKEKTHSVASTIAQKTEQEEEYDETEYEDDEEETEKEETPYASPVLA